MGKYRLIGDSDSNFDGASDRGRGAFKEREVVRLLGSVTREWIRIDFPQALGVSQLTLTPNHRVLTQLGAFIETEKLIQLGAAQAFTTPARGLSLRFIHPASGRSP